MLLALVLVPLAFAAVTFALPSDRWRPWMLPVGGATQLVMVVVALRSPHLEQRPWLEIDPLGRVVLAFLAVLFFLCSVYAPGYLASRSSRPNRVFCTSLLAFLGTMTLTVLSQHLGLMWVAIEACTLSSAPLLYFHRTPRSLEATWKYLLIGSVGIALALLGSFFLAYAALHSGMKPSLFFPDLVQEAPLLSRPWLRAAFVVLFVGYGTKMGLAPMHTWKPDAYGEAPGLVGALLAGGLTSCAFLALMRFFQVCVAAGEGAFAREIMVTIGLVSMAVAGIFMARQRDYKRMLAYSSVEHMGILVLGVGIGGWALFGALLHLVNNGLTKGVLFLAAGNIDRAYDSKSVEEVGGAIRHLPISGTLFLAGFFAITGSPPFGPFFSEFTILRAAFASGQYWTGGLFLLALFVIFMGMGATVLAVVQGEPSAKVAATPKENKDRFLTVAPVIVFMSLVLLLGVYLPPPLESALRDAAAFLERTP
ncbi:MAG TPA: proton-conducting transporter membrane subunit [Myxococcales bacterium]|jgi:hydrogenase-4 component F